MARQAYHVTSGTADPDHIKVTPSTWYNVGAVQSVYLRQIIDGVLLVNTETAAPETSIDLKFPADTALETDGRILYVYGGEGQRFVTDDGVA